MELGKKIRQLRYKSKLTQEQLAEKLAVSGQSVSKWENSVAMPDISLLPQIAETFGISIDDLFDLSTDQHLNRIENRLDIEEELPGDVFREYEDYLKPLLSSEEHGQRATELIAYLYWHRMFSAAREVRRYAREAIRKAPGEKVCQYMLNMAEGHAGWDWNMNNHSKAIDFYRQIVEDNPEVRLPYYYLIDNLIADHRADEAEKYLAEYAGLENGDPIMAEVYRAYIALARFDEREADRIMAELGQKYPDSDVYLFEAAQYYAKKAQYSKAIELYEIAYEKDERRPRFVDALMGIADIYEIMGEYGKAAETYDRIIDASINEWGLKEEFELKDYRREKTRLLTLAQNRK